MRRSEIGGLPLALACALTAAVPLTVAMPLKAQETTAAVVHLRDGSSQPLLEWTLSYEYVSWKQGTSPYLAPTTRKPTLEIWVAKKQYPVKGQTLEIVYGPSQIEREVGGEVKKLDVQVATRLSLGPEGGKRTELKLEAPHKDLVLPQAAKGESVLVRTLDLIGQTLTGTRREFCLASFSSLVECPYDPARQVVKVEFP